MGTEFKKVRPFDSFKSVYRVLTVAGYCRLTTKPKSRYKLFLYQIYRSLAFFINIIYDLQHIIFIIQLKDDLDQLIDGLVFIIPQIILFIKLLTMLWRGSRLEKLHILMDDDIFSPKTKNDADLLLRNSENMNRLAKVINYNVIVVTVLWFLVPFYRRMKDLKAVVPSYTPFETDTWLKFTLSVFMESGTALWTAFGHMSIDCAIATYYAQAKVQLEIIKHNLECLCDSEVEDISMNEGGNFQYRDVVDRSVKERFVHYVKRYDKVFWYVNEINDIFNEAIFFQFLLTAAVICLCAYKMSFMELFSVPFMFYLAIYVCIQTQGFMYCYFGGLVHYESEFVANSLYLGDWVALSPGFRRQLLIAMTRWFRPITPRIARVISLSPSTFVSIAKSSYTLYTILKTRNVNDLVFKD